ncbi:MAG: DUF6134 family protein [Ginsengibacter sp.]
MLTAITFLKTYSSKFFFNLLTIMIMTISNAQQKILHYDIFKGYAVIGHLVIYKIDYGNKILYKLKSNVKAKFIFSYSNEINETVVFENGIMTYSSFLQNENGRGTSIETRLAGNRFEILKNGKLSAKVKTTIQHNILQLYLEPPPGNTLIYSNHFQQFLKLTQLDSLQYRLWLPDGNYNLYSYKNGICTQIDIVHTFFTIHFILKNINNS